MDFTWGQRAGHMAGLVVADGYSGHGAGVNCPEMQEVAMVGPLPRGVYTVMPPITHPRLGPVAMALVPDAANEMFGRSAFYIHGDNGRGDRSASEGCIVLPRAARNAIAQAVSNRHNRLEVVE